jgi:hypothetical protein
MKVVVTPREIVLFLVSAGGAAAFATYAPSPWNFALCALWAGFVGINWSTIWPPRRAHIIDDEVKPIHSSAFAKYNVPTGWCVVHVLEFGEAGSPDHITDIAVVLLGNATTRTMVRGLGESLDDAFTNAIKKIETGDARP